MEIKGSDIIFSSGKIKYANIGIIGISPKGEVTEGYDGAFFDPEFDTEDGEGLTPGECVELADCMIQRWQEFRVKFIR